MRELLCWLDCETTGLDPNGDLLEVAIILTELDLTEVAYQNWVIRAPDNARIESDPFVTAMHDANGLWREVRGPHALDKWDAQTIIKDWLLQHAGATARLYPAGSSVHFDTAWMTVHMPLVAAFFYHRHFDVSSIKMLDQVMGKDYDPGPEDDHRALGDLRNDIKWLDDWFIRVGWSGMVER